MWKITLIASLAAGVLAGGLEAQQHQHRQAEGDSTVETQQAGGTMGMMQDGMMQGMMEMMKMMPARAAMMRVMRFAPRRIRALGDSLDLTAAQAEMLDQLIERHAEARRHTMQTMKSAGQVLSDLFDAEPIDTAAIRSAADEAFQAHAQMHVQMFVEAATVRAMLSVSQREKAMMLKMGPMAMSCGQGSSKNDGHGRKTRQ